MAEALTKDERRELIRDLVIAGVPDQQIIAELGRGQVIDTKGSPWIGKLAKASGTTVRGDLKALTASYRKRTRDMEAADRVAGASLDRLARTAGSAAAEGKWGAAIRADVKLLQQLLADLELGETSEADLDKRIDVALGRRHKPRPRRRRGRLAKLTPQKRTIIVESVRLGMTREATAARARIGVSTLYSWLAQGEDDQHNEVDSRCRDLLEDTQTAAAELQASCLATINSAIRNGSWQASFRFLEARHPEFARQAPVQLQVQTNVQGPTVVQFNLSELQGFDPDQLRAIAYGTDHDDDGTDADADNSPPETTP